MAKEFLSVIRPPVVASLPSGTIGDTVVFSTDGHLYTYDGSAWVDNGAAGGGGGGTVSSVVVDVGSIPVSEKAVTVAAAGVGVNSRVLASVDANMPNGRSYDELEAEPVVIHAHGESAGNLRFILSAARPGGRISGQYRVNYTYT